MRDINIFRSIRSPRSSRLLHLKADLFWRMSTVLRILTTTNINNDKDFNNEQNSFLESQRSFFREFNAECKSIFLARWILFFPVTLNFVRVDVAYCTEIVNGDCDIFKWREKNSKAVVCCKFKKILTFFNVSTHVFHYPWIYIQRDIHTHPQFNGYNIFKNLVQCNRTSSSTGSNRQGEGGQTGLSSLRWLTSRLCFLSL